MLTRDPVPYNSIWTTLRGRTSRVYTGTRAVNCVTARFKFYRNPMCNAIAQRIAHHKLPMSHRLHRAVPL